MRYDPSIHRWNPWTLAELRRELAGRRGRWWLSGGMAIEHHLGRSIRAHGDLDISTCRNDLHPLLNALDDIDVQPWAAVDGHLRRFAVNSIEPVPRNIWVGNETGTNFILQINIEDGDEHEWIYARFPQIRLAWSEAISVVDGIPTGAIVTQLLWKAYAPRTIDDIDLCASWPTLPAVQRYWLQSAIQLAHPHSPWTDIGTV
jgi:hypothetical protein